jgi:tetratricopeptide (TPR) repeat protein
LWVAVGVLPLLGQVRIEGTVRTEGGTLPSSGVSVRIENDDGEVEAQGRANSSGAFTLEGIHKKFCQLVVVAEGFEPFQETLDLTRKASIFEVTVNLIPLRKTNQATLHPAVTDAQAPKNAQKEYEKGEAALNARKLDEAQTHLEKAVAEYPCYARAQTVLAMVLGELGHMAEAEAAAKKARSCDPDFVEAYLQSGMILNNEKKFNESEEALQEGIRRAPSQWQFYYEIAAAHYAQGKFPLAEQDYQRVLSLNSTPPAELHVKLADVYLKENNYSKAYAEMEEYLKEDPNGHFAPKIKGIMQQMQAAGVVQKDKS